MARAELFVAPASLTGHPAVTAAALVALIRPTVAAMAGTAVMGAVTAEVAVAGEISANHRQLAKHPDKVFKPSTPEAAKLVA
jgi:hypothetical protein